jgi:hypothetical protein
VELAPRTPAKVGHVPDTAITGMAPATGVAGRARCLQVWGPVGEIDRADDRLLARRGNTGRHSGDRGYGFDTNQATNRTPVGARRATVLTSPSPR